MRHTLLLLLMLTEWASASAQEQSQPVVTADDYARAESFLSGNTDPLVSGVVADPMWLPDDRLVYQNTTPEGTEFVIIDAIGRTRSRAFDHARLAEALSAAAGTRVDAFGLPIRQSRFSNDGRSISFEIKDRRYTCDVQSYQCAAVEGEDQATGRNVVVSPDGRQAAFIRDHNLWVRDLDTDQETQLTTDGIENFWYATNNAGWTKSDRPVLLWSPDSQQIATFQHDGREVGEMYLVSTKVGHPELSAWKYPLPGDTYIFRLHRIVIHLDDPRVVQLLMPPDPHRSTISDHVSDRSGNWLDVEWSDDASRLAFVSSSRDHKEAKLRLADPETGEVRDVLQETVDTFFESGNGKVNWHVLPESNEVIWFSERDDWGHLYLYDLQTGRLKHQITTGEWNVLQLLRIDKHNRMLYFTGSGREPGEPYFHYLYRVRMDATGLELLTPEAAHHSVSWSSTGDYVLDSYSTPVTPPVSVLRDAEGRRVLTLEEADISRLQAAGWQPPQTDHGQGPRWRHRHLRPDVPADQFRPVTVVPDSQFPVPGAAVGQRRQPVVQGVERREAVAGGARLHRGRSRRHGHAWALQVIPHCVLRQHG